MTKTLTPMPAASPLNRRAFLGGAVLTAGSVLMPEIPRFLHAKQSGVARQEDVAQGTGHVDDACGHWPPYSHAIPYAHAVPAASLWQVVDPIDRMFLT
jgi:hypothetical protein